MSTSARIELDADEGSACCDFASRCVGLESTMHDSGNAQQVCQRQAPMLRSFRTRLRLGMGTGSSHPSSPLQSLARWLLNLVRLHPSARFESRSRCKSGVAVLFRLQTLPPHYGVLYAKHLGFQPLHLPRFYPLEVVGPSQRQDPHLHQVRDFG